MGNKWDKFGDARELEIPRGGKSLVYGNILHSLTKNYKIHWKIRK